MQRIGFLYIVCKNASKSTPMTTEALGRKVRSQLGAPTDITWSDVEQYFNRHRLFSQRYKGRIAPLTQIEYQDSLLADKRLPSSTGAVTDKVYTDIVDEAALWGLVRQQNNTLTDRGAAMLRLWDMSNTGNPLLLDNVCRSACAYWYLDKDGDALRYAFKSLNLDRFDRDELGLAIADGIDRLLIERKSPLVAEKSAFLRLKKLAHSIRHPRGVTIGSGRAITQVSSARAEHLVDLGLLEKPDPTTYLYEMKTASPLRQLPVDLDTFLESEFAQVFGPVITTQLTKSDAAMRWELFVDAYKSLRNPLGYASLRESAVLAFALGIDRGYSAEVSSIVDTVIESRRIHRIRLAVGRSGKPEFVKVEYV
jgi:hypothetical protein